MVPTPTGQAAAETPTLCVPRTLAGFPGGLLEDLFLVEALLGLLLFVGAVEHRPAGHQRQLSTHQSIITIPTADRTGSRLQAITRSC